MVRKDLLTPTEHQIMLYIWNLTKQNPKFILVRSVLECFPEEERPAYTTLTTFIKILVNKNFLELKKVGNLITIKAATSLETYTKRVIKYHLSDFYKDDPAQMIQFILEKNTLTAEQKENLREIL